MDPLRHVVCIRHGQTEMSRAGLFAGRTDVALDEGGRDAASGWSSTFSPTGVEGFHSPLQRAAETARLAGVSSTGLAELQEWDLGELEGRASEEFRREHPDWSLFADGPPGGETVDQVVDRTRAAIDRTTRTFAGEDIAVLVGHGQVLKVLTTLVLGLPLDAATRFTLGPARAAVFTWRPSAAAYTLAGWNRTPVDLGLLVEGNS